MRKLTPSGAPASTHWYETAGLGMFLHWGLSSVRAVGDLSWCMIKDTPYDAELENRNKLTPEEYWKQLGELGLLGLLIPEAHGGAGQGMLEAAIVYEEFGRSLFTPAVQARLGGG